MNYKHCGSGLRRWLYLKQPETGRFNRRSILLNVVWWPVKYLDVLISQESPMPSAGLPQEVTVWPHMPSSSPIQWACYKKKKKKKVEWEAQTGMCRWSTSTFENFCGCTGLDMPEWREMTEQIDWRAKQPSTNSLLLGRSEVLRSLRLPAGTKPRTSQHHIDRLKERGVERESVRRTSYKGWEWAIAN